jgi:hypothetical protein
VCDWLPSKAFIDPASDTRIVETHFAHLRYQLFRFLAYFFMSRPGQYIDILTNEPMACWTP